MALATDLEKQVHETDVSKQVTSFRKSPVRTIYTRDKERGEEAEEERELEIKRKEEEGKGERRKRS